MRYLLKDEGYVLMYSIEGGFDDWQYSEKIPPGFDPSTYTRFKQVNGELVFDPNREEELAKELIKNQWRERRELECFSIINRGKLWYDTLTTSEYEELSQWYLEWMDITNKFEEPHKPEWL